MAQEVPRRRRRRPQEKAKFNISIIIVAAVVLVAAILAVVAICFVVADSKVSIFHKSDEKILKFIEKQTDKEMYFPNIFVDGIEIGGLTREEAQSKLNSAIKLPESDVAVTIKGEGEKYTQAYTMEDFGIYFDLEGAISSAYSFGRTGTEGERIASFKSLENTPQDFQVMYYSEEKIRDIVDGIARGINIEAVDSAVKKTENGFEITPSTVGYTMNAEELYQRVLETVKNRNFGVTVDFAITQNNPKYTEEDFKYIDNEIGSCYSSYKRGDENRITNLRNGCEKINGTVLYPDEVFSTNEKFNPCTYENGWRSAGTIINGKIEDSIGGGMCQVSSALYQAILEAELEVVERFNHSLKVGYADYAFDATLAGDYKDLKFKNNTGYPMYIESYLTSSNVVVKLYGYEVHNAGRRLEFKNELIKTTPPEADIITEDNTKPEGYEEYTLKPLDGRTYNLYKYVYENGSLIDTVLVNKSVYLPRRGELVKGTKKTDEQTESESITEPVTSTVSAKKSEPIENEPPEVIMDNLIEG